MYDLADFTTAMDLLADGILDGIPLDEIVDPLHARPNRRCLRRCQERPARGPQSGHRAVSLIEAIRRAQVIDASPLIWNGTPLFPGHPPVEIESQARTHERDGYFLQTLSLGEHTG